MLAGYFNDRVEEVQIGQLAIQLVQLDLETLLMGSGDSLGLGVLENNPGYQCSSMSRQRVRDDGRVGDEVVAREERIHSNGAAINKQHKYVTGPVDLL